MIISLDIMNDDELYKELIFTPKITEEMLNEESINYKPKLKISFGRSRCSNLLKDFSDINASKEEMIKIYPGSIKKTECQTPLRIKAKTTSNKSVNNNSNNQITFESLLVLYNTSHDETKKKKIIPVEVMKSTDNRLRTRTTSYTKSSSNYYSSVCSVSNKLDSPSKKLPILRLTEPTTTKGNHGRLFNKSKLNKKNDKTFSLNPSSLPHKDAVHFPPM